MPIRSAVLAFQLKLRLLLLPAMSAVLACAGCASPAAANQSWVLRITPPPTKCVFAVNFQWDGLSMLDFNRGTVPKACSSLSGWLSIDGPIPSSPFFASWTDDNGKEHKVRLDVRSRLAGYVLPGSYIRLELANEGVRVLLSEGDRTKTTAGGFIPPKPEVLLFTQSD